MVKLTVMVGAGVSLILSVALTAIATAFGVSGFDQDRAVNSALVRCFLCALIIVVLVFSERPARVRRAWAHARLPEEFAETVMTDSTTAELRPTHHGEDDEALLAVQPRISDLWRGGHALRVQRMCQQITERRDIHSPQSA